MTHIIAEPCIDELDGSCVDVCPVDCIYGADPTSTSNLEKEIKEKLTPQLYIHPEECIDCGLCVDACPVEAIYPEEDLPEKWYPFIAKNYEHFDLEPPDV